MTGVWVAADTITAARMNEKTIFQGTGAAISGLATTYAGMLAYCTSGGSGFSVDRAYVRNAANTAWILLGGGESGDEVYPLDVTIGDYSSPSLAVGSSQTSDAGFIDGYLTNSGWTQVGTAITVDSGTTDKLDGTSVVANADHRVYKSLGFTLSDSLWVSEFELNITALATNSQGFPVWLSAGTGKPRDGATDGIGVMIQDPAGTNQILIIKSNGGTLATSTAMTLPLSTLFYCRLERTSTTNARLSVFTDSGRTAHQAGSPINYTIDSTITTLTTLQHSSDDGGGVADAWSGTIDNMHIATGTGTITYNTSSNTIDGNTGTRWQSLLENNPNIYFDLSSVRDIASIAINLDRTNTTETQIKIRASTDTTFTDGETIRYIDISDLTDDTWRFFPVNRLSADSRYIQFYGISNSVTLAINEVKVYYTPALADWNRKHYHKKISVTSSDNGLDSN